jgi:hypothetical protein
MEEEKNRLQQQCKKMGVVKVKCEYGGPGPGPRRSAQPNQMEMEWKRMDGWRHWSTDQMVNWPKKEKKTLIKFLQF